MISRISRLTVIYFIYTQSGNVKRYEIDCIKGIKLFDWPSYTCAPQRNGTTITSYIPIPRYTVKNLLDCYCMASGVNITKFSNYLSAYLSNDKYKDLGNLTYSYVLKNSNNTELYMYIPDIYNNRYYGVSIGIDIYLSEFSENFDTQLSTYNCTFYSYNSYACSEINNKNNKPLLYLKSECLDYDGPTFVSDQTGQKKINTSYSVHWSFNTINGI